MNISQRAKKCFFIGLFAVGCILIVMSFNGAGSKTPVVAATVAWGTVERNVNVSGHVKSSEKIDMAFDRGGRITVVAVRVGQRVMNGQLLVTVDATDLHAQLLQAQAGTAMVRARLNQLTNASRVEDVNAAIIAAAAARNNLVVEQMAMAGTVRTAFNIAADAMTTATDIQFTYLNNTYSESIRVADKKAAALQALYGEVNLGHVGAWYFIPLTGGLHGRILALNGTTSVTELQSVAGNLAEALTLVRAVLDEESSNLSNINAVTDADKANVVAARVSVLTQVTTIAARQQTITNAVSAVAQAEATVASRRVPGSTYDIENARAQVLQAEAGVALVRAQIEQRIIRAPLAGTVVSLDAIRGEQAIAGKIIVSVLGTAPFHIETNVAESDVATVTVGDTARVTVDAFGTDKFFEATVINVDPAETIVEGVTTYKTRLTFAKIYPEIRSGMTADVVIAADKVTNALFVPSRFVVARNGKKYVKILENGASIEIEVITGLRGTDGRMEIKSGLTEGQLLVGR